MKGLGLSALAAVSFIVVVGAACGDGDGAEISEEQARNRLPQMVLQDGDVPQGLQRAGEAFTTNEQLAQGGLGSASIEQLQDWGRILGYDLNYEVAESAGGPFTALDSAVSLHRTSEGASQSFADLQRRAREADWMQFYSDLFTFEQQELTRDVPADEVIWLRLSGQRRKETGPGAVLVIDDQIVFRVDSARSFLRVVSINEGTVDRNLGVEQVEALLRTQIQHTRDTLATLTAD